MLWLAGSITNRLITLAELDSDQSSPVVFQVWPPSVLFKTPTENVEPPPLASSRLPVDRYMILGCTGSYTISETPSEANVSVLVLQLKPPSVDFHKPPVGLPAHIVF